MVRLARSRLPSPASASPGAYSRSFIYKLKTSKKVEQLYLITLARKPTAAESSRLVKYVDAGGPKKDSARALCDVFWALLNSSEFCTNH